MEIKFVFIVIAVIYWVFKSFYGKADNKSVPTPKNNKAPHPTNNTNSQKSVEDIFNEFVREVEKKKNPIPQVETVKPRTIKKEAVDWQQVTKSKIIPKTQLIKHEDYHTEHGKIEDITSIDQISETEGKIYEFNIENIDWKQAIIAKEILDRKYA